MTTVAASDPAAGSASPEAEWGGVRAAVILVAHGVLDGYAAIVPAVLGLLEARCQLDESSQTPLIMVAVALLAGISQPICAILSDRYDSRVFGGIGLALAAVCLSAVGWANAFPTLMWLVVLGYFGVGMFHPIAASSIGQIRDRWRSPAVSAFFVVGMLGGAAGSFWAPRYVVRSGGFQHLAYWCLPGLAIALLLHWSVRRLPHRHHPDRFRFQPHDLAGRWRMIGLLYVVTTLRATVYVGLQYMYVRWVQASVAADHPTWGVGQIADAAAPVIGNLNSMTIVGMGLGGLGAGILIRNGREKVPMILVPIVFAAAVYSLPHGSLEASYGMGLLAGIGFAAMAPVTLAVAQRLLPHRTSLASALMLGGAWAVAASGARLAQWLIPHIGIVPIFHLLAGAMLLSGLLAIPMRMPGGPSRRDRLS